MRSSAVLAGVVAGALENQVEVKSASPGAPKRWSSASSDAFLEEILISPQRNLVAVRKQTCFDSI